MAHSITKADGETEPFKPQKLLASLARSGASSDMAQHVLRQIERELYDGITTSEIYRRAFAHLRKDKRAVAARYSLKRALLDFGPTGFPFESYLAEMFRAEGYQATVDRVVTGRCVEHEVDVVLTRGTEVTYVEAKFHNAAGFRTDLKVALYVQARVEDIGNGTGMLVTNTKFTSHAVAYAKCRGLELLGWEYPSGKTLQDRIEAAGVYPITALTTLTRREKAVLLGKRVVLCNHLAQQGGALVQAGVSGRRADGVLAEAAALCTKGV
jgi:hypothetical protein